MSNPLWLFISAISMLHIFKFKRKAVFLSCLIYCFSLAVTYGQTTKGLIKAGAGFATLVSSQQSKGKNSALSSRFAYQFGVGLKQQFTEQLSFQAELLYLKQGASIGKNDSVSMSFNSAGVAALFQYKPLPKLELETGLLPNYTFSVTNGSGHDLSKVWDVWRYDIGLLLGMRYFITEKLAVNPRLNFGLLARKSTRSVTNDGANIEIIEDRFNHLSVQISLEYMIDL